MTDVTQGVETQPGIERATDGTIQDPSQTSTQTSTTTDSGSGKDQTQDQTTIQATATEKKPTLLNQKEAPKEATKEPGKETPKEGVPDKYEFKLPDGLELIPEVATEVNALFKDLGLSAESGQKLMDFYVSKTQEALAQPYEAYQETVNKWGEEAQAHPELRGKLGPGKEVTVRIGRFLDSLPDQQLAADFREHMDLTGAGNHQAFIRVLDYVTKQLTEGTHVAGNGPSKAGQSAPGQATQPSAAQAMYPHLPSTSRG